MVRVRRQDGTVVEGFARNEGNQTLPLQTVDGRLVLPRERSTRVCRRNGQPHAGAESHCR